MQFNEAAAKLEGSTYMKRRGRDQRVSRREKGKECKGEERGIVDKRGFVYMRRASFRLG